MDDIITLLENSISQLKDHQQWIGDQDYPKAMKSAMIRSVGLAIAFYIKDLNYIKENYNEKTQ